MLKHPHTENWVNVPTNSILTIHNQTVMVHPIIDQYYNRSPYYVRSSAFVQTKGLATNEKSAVPARPGTPLGSPGLAPDLSEIQTLKRTHGPTIPFAVSRSRTPESSHLAPRGWAPISLSRPDPPDVRSVTAPPVVRPTPPPAQGNIKRKRASLSAVEVQTQAEGIQALLLDTEPGTPGTPEPPRTEFGNPHKIAQFFPELTLSP